MKIKFITNIVFLFFMSICSLGARPISYPGGWTVMQMNDFNSHSLHVHYTPSSKYSFGYRVNLQSIGGKKIGSFMVVNLII